MGDYLQWGDSRGEPCCIGGDAIVSFFFDTPLSQKVSTARWVDPFYLLATET
jgi:hypothetical protein